MMDNLDLLSRTPPHNPDYDFRNDHSYSFPSDNGVKTPRANTGQINGHRICYGPEDGSFMNKVESGECEYGNSEHSFEKPQFRPEDKADQDLVTQAATPSFNQAPLPL